MTRVTSLKEGNFRVQFDSRRVFETLPVLKSFNLVPDGKVTLTGYSFSFPDLQKDAWYYFAGKGPVSGVLGADSVTGCESYTALIAQEWGPGRAIDIADTYLGDLPPYTEYLDVRLKLTRTVAPSQVMGMDMPTICNGQWISLEGGASIIEGWVSGVMRSVAFVIDHPGEAVCKCYLRRYQSVRDISLATTVTTSPGWSVGVSNHGLFANLIQAANPSYYNSPAPAHYFERGNAVSCSLSVQGNWLSTYTGDIEITPGRVSAAS